MILYWLEVIFAPDWGAFNQAPARQQCPCSKLELGIVSNDEAQHTAVSGL